MTREEIVKLIENAGTSPLDRLVHEVYSEAASAVNNESPDSQITVLLDSGYTLKEIEKEALKGISMEKEADIESLCPYSEADSICTEDSDA